MSFGMSTRTGPVRPVLASWNACRMDEASWFTSRTMKLCFVMGIVIPMMSVSWKASLPHRSLLTWAVIATIGVESM